MYKSIRIDIQSPCLWNCFPLEGSWIRIAELIPWKEIEDEYAGRHAKRGRPSKDSRLIVGLLILKHLTGLSDVEVVQSVQ